jgi:peptidoglycan hydrolase-like protein with peptidoglycan-binding domain
LSGARKLRGLLAGAAAPLSGRPGRQAVTLAVAIAALIAVAGGFTLVLTGHSGSSRAAAAVRPKARASKPAHATAPLRVLSVSPARQARGVNGADPVQITFSAPRAAGSPLPRIRPSVSGSWSPAQGNELVFTPATAFSPQSTFTVSIPAGLRSASGTSLGRPVTVRFHTRGYSTLRLQQLLAQLGYLPLTWTPLSSTPAAGDTAAQLAAAYSPPAGLFNWQRGYPGTLVALWQAGSSNLIQVGAIRAFESDQGLTMDGVAGPAVWRHLLRAVASGQSNPHGYTYAIASKHSPETLTIWHDGRVVLHSLANTGIAVAPTVDGTYPVYWRLPFQIMKGTNPDGTKYADPVQNVAYFHGGDAVHYFPRASFGWPQSLGCVELPLPQSAVAYHYLTYGSLVAVTG